jgi:flavin reductase (DIM6/NTAB) family NADH-FMN oxidoreductase RutF
MNTKAVAAVGWNARDIAAYMRSAGGLDPFAMIGKDWMLVGAGTPDDWNAMTASWGGVGVLWGKNVAFCFVRPSRHTHGYAERSDRLVLSFFDGSRRAALNYFGAVSGRDADKAAGGGLTPIAFEDGTVSFAEARLVLSCRKLYAQNLAPDSFLDPSIIAGNYPKGDFHTMYVAEIETVRTPNSIKNY